MSSLLVLNPVFDDFGEVCVTAPTSTLLVRRRDSPPGASRTGRSRLTTSLGGPNTARLNIAGADRSR
jgi:hypothetical protein